MAQLEAAHAGTTTGLQVVFVHGLNLYGKPDHHRATWMRDPGDEGTLWPKWLGTATGCSTWLLQYDADAFAWTGNAMGLSDQGTAVLNLLGRDSRLNAQPIALVGHSMGGLVIKKALVFAATQATEPTLKNVLPRVKAVVFVASPHQGSQLASLAKLVGAVSGTNPPLASMAQNDEHLSTLNGQFKKVATDNSLQARAFAEGHPFPLAKRIFGFRLGWGGDLFVVDRNSSDPGLPGCDLIRLPAHHIDIAKPKSRLEEPFLTLQGLVRSLQSSPPEPPDTPGTPGTPDPPDPEIPWPQLPPLDRALSPAEATTVRTWARAPVTGLQSWALHRYATLRLGRLGGEESSGHESFVNLHLQPNRTPAGQAMAVQAPEPFDSMDRLLESTGAGDALWLLKGAPGAGKSTLLLDLELRRLHAAIEHWRSASAGLPEVCVRISLADFDATLPQVDLSQVLPARWAEQCVPGGAEGGHAFTLKALRSQARLRPLLDGLNEIKVSNHEGRRRFVDAVHAWATQALHSGGAPAVFTVRHLNYLPFRDSAQWAEVRVVDVQGWTQLQIRAYCDKRFPGQGNPVWNAVQALPRQQCEAMLELFANPFNLAAQCWLYGQPGGVLAPNRGLLLGRMGLLRLKDAIARRVAEVLAPGLLNLETDETDIATQAALSPPGALHALQLRGALLPRLQGLATEMQRRAPGGWGQWRPVALPQASDETVEIEAALRAAQAVKIACQRADGAWQFDHQLWQEYFAAWPLAQACEVADWPDFVPPPARPVPEDAWELPPPEPSPWDQCAQMAVQIAGSRWALLNHLTRVNLALAARAVLAREGDVPQQRLEQIKSGLLQRLQSPAASTSERIEAGELLGQLGDDLRYASIQRTGAARCLVPRQDLWIALPSGSQQVGGLVDYDNSRSVVGVSIPPDLRLAYAPVTNAEFRCFVEAGGYGQGDEPPPWWQGSAALDWWHGKSADEGRRTAWQACRRRWKEEGPEAAASVFLTNFRPDEIDRDVAPRMAMSDADFDTWLDEICQPQRHRKPAWWSDSRFNNPLQPVVGVSLHEAQAYARWLALQWGRPVRLPTEAEWEVAARGGGRRGVHWPGQSAAGPTAEQANSLATRARRSTPVGAFPAGAAPEGWVDLAGNVWQWTESIYTADGMQPEAVNSAADLSSNLARAVRGGSWINQPRDCRAAIRLGFVPGNRDSTLGFRLVCCPIQNPGP
jgi:formylglycine-generating enzyme required for sulfatase activity